MEDREIAREVRSVTVFDPARVLSFDDALYALSDHITSNENGTAALSTIPVETIEGACHTGDFILALSANCARVMLGNKGAVLRSVGNTERITVFRAGAVKETTGAGDTCSSSYEAILVKSTTACDLTRFDAACSCHLDDTCRRHALNAHTHRRRCDAGLRRLAGICT